MVGSFITDYINYSLAKREVPNIYIEGGVGYGKMAICRLTKKI